MQYQLRGSCNHEFDTNRQFDTQYTLINTTHLIGNLNTLMIYDKNFSFPKWSIVDKTDIRGVIFYKSIFN